MHPLRPKVENIDEYLKLFPSDTQEKLEQIRALIKESAPDTTETISYAIPCYKLGKKPVIYFAGYEKHVGIYPLPHNIDEAFEKELSSYVAGKGTLKFMLNQPLPIALIKKVILHKYAEAARNA